MALITAVMPTTASREHFWDRAINCFLRQTFTDSELLIVEEGPAHGGYIHPRIRHVNLLGTGRTTGQKRNAANSFVQSPFIINWDDDDWHHPERIATQLGHLQATGKCVVGYHDLLYFRATDRTFWQYNFMGRPPYAPGTSMCYRRVWWEVNKFEPRSIGEDSAFSMNAARQGVLESKPLSKMIVAVAHDRNTYQVPFGRAPFVEASRDVFPEEFLTSSHFTGMRESLCLSSHPSSAS